MKLCFSRIFVIREKSKYYDYNKYMRMQECNLNYLKMWNYILFKKFKMIQSTIHNVHEKYEVGEIICQKKKNLKSILKTQIQKCISKYQIQNTFGVSSRLFKTT